jgi:predicted ATPase
MIRRLHATNFGCLKAVTTPDFGALHAFIGPNDSGKSTLLRALACLSIFGGNHPLQEREREMDSFRNYRRPGQHEGVVLVAEADDSFFKLQDSDRGRKQFSGIRLGTDGPTSSHTDWNAGGSLNIASLSVGKALASYKLVRFDPDALRLPSELIPAEARVDFTDARGTGLPGVLDAVVNKGDDSFRNLVEEVRVKFPVVRRLGLKAISKSTKVIEVELNDGTVVPSENLSEGLLYFVAFLAIQCLEPTALLLVEEPENGLHPSRVAEVVRVLRAISESGRTQVFIATHSPLVVNELRPDEVTVVTRDREKGTQLRLLKDTPNFEERSKVYALGELWLSYANGLDEAPLLTATPAHS